MTTYNDQLNNRYIAGHLAGVTANTDSKRRVMGLLSALRGHADWELIRSWVWPRSGGGLEADTRQIRNYRRSRTPGACEVRLGLRLAT
ncbi:MAG: hypothetical protein M3092_09350 [Actinomycetia bacterium]|nr:hypothetical protein [Actinomycetes bacterium]